MVTQDVEDNATVNILACCEGWLLGLLGQPSEEFQVIIWPHEYLGCVLVWFVSFVCLALSILFVCF